MLKRMQFFSSVTAERVRQLNAKPTRNGDYVLYWMQQSQRAEENHALEYAVQKANAMGLPLVAAFGLTERYPDANLRHYKFMIEGLREVQKTLASRKVLFVVQHGGPAEVALRVGRRAGAIVCDRGYLRHQKQWREQVARGAACPVEEVEADVIVPVELVSQKSETAARTFRSKIMPLYPHFLSTPHPTRPIASSLTLPIGTLNLDDEDAVLGPLSIDTRVKPVSAFKGGTRTAKKMLARFLRSGLPGYAENRNQPQTEHVSRMSPYLHFGQISPAYVARKIGESRTGAWGDRESCLDELIVQRELSFNFVHFVPDYDQYRSVPEWARKTLGHHTEDRRPFIYSRAELEAAKTADPYWNAAMNEMKHTGYMHNHMRMYWGKQILTWSRTPEIAFRTALELNNKYFLDGRDPNAFSNVGWIFGLHDRPWPEREIFGTVRTMTSGGLRRKTDADAYVQKVQASMDSNK